MKRFSTSVAAIGLAALTVFSSSHIAEAQMPLEAQNLQLTLLESTIRTEELAAVFRECDTLTLNLQEAKNMTEQQFRDRYVVSEEEKAQMRENYSPENYQRYLKLQQRSINAGVERVKACGGFKDSTASSSLSSDGSSVATLFERMWGILATVIKLMGFMQMLQPQAD
ncbi:hypothetical protein [Corynebacterium aquilae]|uniref:Uncharacterized protein n=1 Tax=Corynebacterium aquilae DSM 44791 TaxID=1431546 RepID=A0A1L7CE38_9CORY|nr:hypothetical protein [Corynebacterium aquilae]APT84140.1 hypothetical protein CAQU_02600 [Corynebacterium aquilae DSM 44791]